MHSFSLGQINQNAKCRYSMDTELLMMYSFERNVWFSINLRKYRNKGRKFRVFLNMTAKAHSFANREIRLFTTAAYICIVCIFGK